MKTTWYLLAKLQLGYYSRVSFVLNIEKESTTCSVDKSLSGEKWIFDDGFTKLVPNHKCFAANVGKNGDRFICLEL